jgi:hypothetical protein
LQYLALFPLPFLEGIVGDVLLGLSHQVQVKVQVVNACKRESERFAGMV